MHRIQNRGGVDPRALAELEEAVHDHSTLERVVRWALLQSPPQLIDTVIRQDEYTLDVVVPLASGLCLVYDTT